MQRCINVTAINANANTTLPTDTCSFVRSHEINGIVRWRRKAKFLEVEGKGKFELIVRVNGALTYCIIEIEIHKLVECVRT